MIEGLRYFCDEMRHLVCVPYSDENLHRMADDLGIKRCWFHRSPKHHHYDIPKKRIAEISAQCTKVSPRTILEIIKGEWSEAAPPTYNDEDTAQGSDRR